MPKFSIIVPVYNVENYISQCIDSILQQTYSDFELIIIDDGSTDSSLQICHNYVDLDARVRVFHQDNSGVSAARNYGLGLSCGEWITFVDSDDWIEANYLANFVLDSDDCDIVVQGLEYYDNRINSYFKRINISECILKKPNIVKQVSDNRLLHLGYPVAKAYRKSLINQGLRFCETISYHEDHIFVMDAFDKAQNIRLVNSVEYKYRYYHNSISLSSKRHSWENLNYSSDMMITKLNRLRAVFLQPGSLYEREIYNFAFSPKISALFESAKMYKLGTLRQIFPVIIKANELKAYYKPISLKERLIKIILYYCPIIVQVLFFRLYIKYQSRR